MVHPILRLHLSASRTTQPSIAVHPEAEEGKSPDSAFGDGLRPYAAEIERARIGVAEVVLGGTHKVG
jgi:hypothetical protein